MAFVTRGGYAFLFTLTRQRLFVLVRFFDRGYRAHFRRERYGNRANSLRDLRRILRNRFFLFPLLWRNDHVPWNVRADRNFFRYIVASPPL